MPRKPKVEFGDTIHLTDRVKLLDYGTDPLAAKSLVPVIQGKQPKVRDIMFNSYRECQRSIRDERWKLIRYPLIDKTQLFDLQTDPHEMTDLAANPEYAGKINELTALLEKTGKSLGDTAPLIVTNPAPAVWMPENGRAGKKSAKARAKQSKEKED